MGSKTVELTGRDRLWYQHREGKTQPARSGWKRHLLVVVALIGFKLAAITGSSGVEMLTSWLNDTRGLVGWP
ncbi:hypothetical protein JST97_00345 [bacterium]|nr:hypothetical protein [bacterium]